MIRVAIAAGKTPREIQVFTVPSARTMTWFGNILHLRDGDGKIIGSFHRNIFLWAVEEKVQTPEVFDD